MPRERPEPDADPRRQGRQALESATRAAVDAARGLPFPTGARALRLPAIARTRQGFLVWHHRVRQHTALVEHATDRQLSREYSWAGAPEGHNVYGERVPGWPAIPQDRLRPSLTGAWAAKVAEAVEDSRNDECSTDDLARRLSTEGFARWCLELTDDPGHARQLASYFPVRN